VWGVLSHMCKGSCVFAHDKQDMVELEFFLSAVHVVWVLSSTTIEKPPQGCIAPVEVLVSAPSEKVCSWVPPEKLGSNLVENNYYSFITLLPVE
jgi:hypothetical protein